MPEILPDTPPSPSRTQPRRVRAVAAATFFVGLLSLGGWWAGRQLTAAEQPSREPLGGARLFDQVAAMISQRSVDSLGADELYDKAVAGMLRELGDPYTTYLAEDRLRRLNEQISGTYAGIGLQIDIRDGWPVVLEPINGGPSERAGILAGDRIVQIGKESTRGWTRDEVSRVVRGPQGTAVNFLVERGDQRIPFSIVRDKVHLRAVQRVALLPNGVGYVDVNVFSAQTADELRMAVDSVVHLGARSLVMDLRAIPAVCSNRVWPWPSCSSIADRASCNCAGVRVRRVRHTPIRCRSAGPRCRWRCCSIDRVPVRRRSWPVRCRIMTAPSWWA